MVTVRDSEPGTVPIAQDMVGAVIAQPPCVEVADTMVAAAPLQLTGVVHDHQTPSPVLALILTAVIIANVSTATNPAPGFLGFFEGDR